MLGATYYHARGMLFSSSSDPSPLDEPMDLSPLRDNLAPRAAERQGFLAMMLQAGRKTRSHSIS